MASKCAGILKFYEGCSYKMVHNTELFFYRLGCKVASKPLSTIAVCWGVVFISAIGFLRFHQEKNPMNLWVPPDSPFASDTKWLLSKVDNGIRVEAAIFKAKDVLTPEVFIQLANIDKKVRDSVSSKGIKWTDVCFKVQYMDNGLLDFLYKPYKNKSMSDPSVEMNSATYCEFLDTMGTECYERSVLDLWQYNLRKIKKLTKADILNEINTYKKNPILDKLKNYEALLGGITRNESGHIVAATTVHNFWMANVNFSAIDMDKSGNNAGTADWASEECLDWELEFTNVMENASKSLENIELFFEAGRNFGDISNSAMFSDIDKVLIGACVMILYVQFVISKFNWLEARLLLGGLGLLSVVMSFVVSVGLCSGLGISYGPVHTSLPFLLMGLGVDDMFVIMACYEGLSQSQKLLPLNEKLGLVLKHAGVSITVTSFTDVVAFLVGSYTILPCLESYCIYAAIGVLMTSVFACTFFMACFAVDERRLNSKRNGTIPCIKHPDYEMVGCSQRSLTREVFHFMYSKIVFSAPGKIFVILVVLINFGLSMESVFKLEQRFDVMWFIPKSSDFYQYIEQRKQFYPLMGFEGGIYMGAVNYTQELGKIKALVDQMANYSDIGTDIISWVEPFHTYVHKHFKKDIYEEVLTENEFNLFLSKFLFSPYTARFQANFKFEKPLECGIPAPKIILSTIYFQFNHFNTKEKSIPAMHKMRDLATNVNFTTGERFAMAWSIAFSTWTTDEVIDTEVSRNLQLALLCVMVCTVPLIANIYVCFWVFMCVLLTMVNVLGYMQRWGLTIDLVSCIGLELAIGLCVDYATHVGHTYLTIQEGNTQERALKTVTSIGSAVVYGGISMLIGVSMLSISQAYTFQSFFKIFLLVILFGLFHGVVFLPVILSWIGPKPYQQKKKVENQSDVILY